MTTAILPDASPAVQTVPVICGHLELQRITYSPERKRALVEFTVGAEAPQRVRLWVKAAAIQSFVAFQRVALDEAGVMVRESEIEDARTAREAAEEWRYLVDRAVEAGKEEAAR